VTFVSDAGFYLMIAVMASGEFESVEKKER
jgi:hypothetical protein